MTHLLYGDRIGQFGKIAVCCCAIINDEKRSRILLTQRSDNKKWCLPGGFMESGESISEACIREVKEETGLNVRISKLVGVYSDPNRITEYVDGNKYQLVTLSFEAEVLDGNLSINEESIQAGYFLLSEIDELDILEPHRIRIHDALSDSLITFIR